MVKTFFKTCVFIAMTSLMASCGGDGLSAGSCIGVAEDSVELKESPMLGELPTLSDQYTLAKVIANNTYQDLFDATVRQNKDGEIDKSELNDRLGELHKRKEDVFEEIDAHYMGKLNDMAEELKGKELPVKFDDEIFSSAKVTISEVKITDGGYFTVLLDTKLETVLEPDEAVNAYVVHMLDENGDILMVRNHGENVACSTSFGLTSDGRPQTFFGSGERLFGNLAYYEGAGLYFGRS